MSRSPMEVHKLLPQTNCGECDLPSCMAFAVKFLKGEKSVGDCPPLKEPTNVRKRMALNEIQAETLKATPTNLVIRGDLCTGCGNCVVACPLNVSVSQDVAGGKGPLSKDVIMGVEDGTIKVLNLEICRRNEDEMEGQPCRICIDACPIKGAIEFV